MTDLSQPRLILSTKYNEPGMGCASIFTFCIALFCLMIMNGDNFIFLLIGFLMFTTISLEFLANWFNTREVWFENGRLLTKSKPLPTLPFFQRRSQKDVEIEGSDKAILIVNKATKGLLNYKYKLGIVMVDGEEITLLPIYELNHAEESVEMLNNALTESKKRLYD